MEMSETFTASNGVQLDELGFHRHGSTIAARVHEARVEFYRHLRDQEFGVWRNLERPHHVGYPTSPHTVFILDEATGRGAEYSKASVAVSSNSYGDRLKRESARAYFAAHPEPKPWHTPDHLEIWALKIEGCLREAYVYRDDHTGSWFRPVNNEARVRFQPDDPLIEDARRIWPEVS